MTYLKLALALVLFLSPLSPSHANDWEGYESISGYYQLRIPEDHERERNRFRIAPGFSIYSEKISGKKDFRPFKDNINHYTVKFDQTLGDPLTDNEKDEIIKRDLERYLNFYRKNKNAILKKEELMYHGDAHAGEIYISFEDEKFGPRGVRIKAIVHDNYRIIAALNVNDRAAFSVVSNDFFDTIKLKNKIIDRSSQQESDWNTNTSPLNIFSVMTPPIIEPYVTQKPEIKSSINKETMSMVILDPVREQPINVKTTAYKIDSEFNRTILKKLITQEHLSNYVTNVSQIAFDEIEDQNGREGVEANFFLSKPKGHPSSDAVYINAVSKKNFAIVQEVHTSRALINAPITKALRGMVFFHPENHAPARTFEEEEFEFIEE